MNLKKLMKVKDSEADFVGAQSFTYDELAAAFDELKTRADADDDNESDFSYFFNFDLEKVGNVNADFDLNALADVLEQTPKKIKNAYIEVYYKIGNTKGDDDHGIVIRNGKIETTY